MTGPIPAPDAGQPAAKPQGVDPAGSQRFFNQTGRTPEEMFLDLISGEADD
ncbi:MAG: hypothetical protein GX424_02910 [Clostridiales bacterium]|nr:hypothetical protein [Clostridiales bacterium]